MSKTQTEIVKTPSGRLIAKVVWEIYTFTEELPDDFGTWTLPMQRRYLKSHVVPKLLYRVAKAKAAKGKK